MYGGDITLTPENAIPLLAMSDHYLIRYERLLGASFADPSPVSLSIFSLFVRFCAGTSTRSVAISSSVRPAKRTPFRCWRRRCSQCLLYALLFIALTPFTYCPNLRPNTVYYFSLPPSSFVKYCLLFLSASLFFLSLSLVRVRTRSLAHCASFYFLPSHFLSFLVSL